MKKIFTCVSLLVLSLVLKAQPSYQWAHVIGEGVSDDLRSITSDASGNLFVIGDYYGTVDMDPSSGVTNLSSTAWGGGQTRDIMVAKYSASGTLLWAKTFGNIGPDLGFDIALNSTGDVFITGAFTNTTYFGTTALAAAHQVYSGYLVKINGSNGTVVWAKDIGGYSSSDYGTSVTVDNNDNIYIGGNYSTSFDIDPGTGIVNLPTASSDNIFIAKYDPAGNYIWGNGIAGAGSDLLSNLKTDAHGNLIAVGSFTNTLDFDFNGTYNLTSQNEDGFIWKMNPNGELRWVYRLGGNNYQGASDVVAGANDTLFVCGSFLHHITVGANITVANNDAGNRDGFILKLDSLGNSFGIRAIGGTDQGESLESIATDGVGNIYVSGGLGSLAELNSTTNSVLLGTAHGIDPYVGKYNSQLEHVWHYLLMGSDPTGLPLGDVAQSITVSGGSIAIAGYINENVYSDFTNYQDSIIHIGEFDGFIHKVQVNIPLPMKWLSFEAMVKEQHVMLQWETGNEINCVHYSVERSLDAQHWKSIGKVLALNQVKNTYQYVDTDLEDGEWYYRIQQQDVDGNIHYSEVRKVSTRNQTIIDFRIVPNPATHNLIVSTDGGAEIAVGIYTQQGLNVWQQEVKGSITLDISNWAVGIYYVVCVQGQTKTGQWFIKN